MMQDVKNMSVEKNSRRLFRNDMIFIVVLLLLVTAFGLWIYLVRGEGDRVVVTIDG